MDTLHGTIPIATGVLSTLTPRVENMRKRLIPEMLATDLAGGLASRWGGRPRAFFNCVANIHRLSHAFPCPL